MADHFAMDGIADYSIISGLQTTYIQRSTTALNHPICCICQCKFLNNRISGRKWDSQPASERASWASSLSAQSKCYVNVSRLFMIF